jgi:hypothetical protein
VSCDERSEATSKSLLDIAPCCVLLSLCSSLAHQHSHTSVEFVLTLEKLAAMSSVKVLMPDFSSLASAWLAEFESISILVHFLARMSF